MKKKALSLALALAVCLGLTVPAFAAPEQNTVHASNEEQLLAALRSNTTIILESKTYKTGLIMEDLENVTIQGTGSTRLVMDNGGDQVITLYGCKNITLSGLVIGHDIEPEAYCSAGVLDGWKTSLTMINCDIFGCGVSGIYFGDGSIKMQDSVIRDCSEEIMGLYDGQFTFQGCTFSGNGYALDTPNHQTGIHVAAYDKDSVLTFNDCTFSNNKMGVFVSTSAEEGVTASYTLNRCVFQGNSWPEQISGVQAMPTNDKLTSDGVVQNPTVYKINGSNYFKIRDLAAVLNGTEKQFEVGYDGATKSVTATTGKGYVKGSGDLAGAASSNEAATVSNDTIYVDGVKIQAEVYKIGGNNYFKLRDLGRALDFYVGYEKENGMFIDTTKPYTE